MYYERKSIASNNRIIEIFPDGLFHVHTYRCKHAGEDSDESYIKRAIELGKKEIVFTDHAPYPGNPFGNRMDYEELSEYIASLSELKEKYSDRISVLIGLEVEYLSSFTDYYKELSEIKALEWLIIGQHMYEHVPGIYSFSDSNEVKDKTEYIGLCEAMIDGMETGMFRAVAHPDRAFRRCKVWNEDMQKLSRRLIDTALRNNIVLEKNMASMRQKHHYWDEFWRLLNSILEEDHEKRAYVVRGVDAHSVEELRSKALIPLNKSI